MKKIITAIAIGAVASAQAGLVVGDFVNFDYGTGNGPSSGTHAGPVNTGLWNTGATFDGPGGEINSAGGAVNIGSFTANGTAGSSGFASWGTDPVGQDYAWVGGANNGTNLNGRAVGSFRRFTLFTNGGLSDGLATDQTWDITFFGGGDAAGQGMNIDLNNGGLIETASASGANQGDVGTWGYSADNTITFTGVTPTAISGGAEIEFWIWVDDAAVNWTPQSFSAISGVQMELTAIPEPATLGFVAIFGGGLLFIRRRFKI